MKKLKNITISFLADIKNSRANCGEGFLGNESTVKNFQGKNYISGQSIRQSLLGTMENLNKNEETDTYFSLSDSVVDQEKPKQELTKNIAFDFRGMMIPKTGFSRNSAFKTNIAESLTPSENFFDLLLKFQSTGTDHAIAKMEISKQDKMLFNFSLDVERVLGLDEINSNEISNDGVLLTKNIVPAIDDENTFLKEKTRRVKLFLEAIENYNGFANQSRNVIDPTPKEMILVYNHIAHDNKYLNFFDMSLDEKIPLLKYAKKKNIKFLIFDKELASNAELKAEFDVKDSIYDVFFEMLNIVDNYDLKI